MSRQVKNSMLTLLLWFKKMNADVSETGRNVYVSLRQKILDFDANLDKLCDYDTFKTDMIEVRIIINPKRSQ